MSSEKPTITKAQKKKSEAKKPGHLNKWRIERAQKRRKKAAQLKAKAIREAKNRKSYLDAIGKGTSSGVKQKAKVQKYVKSPRKVKKFKIINPAKLGLSAKRVSVLAIVAAIIVAGGVLLFGRGHDRDIAATLGDSTEVISGELPASEPSFKLLFPIDTEPSAYDARQTNPPGNDPTYTYLDRFASDEPIFQVTEQQVPEGDFDIVKVATDFQATNTIQVDGIIVYHGFNERDNVQSLIFVKDGILVSIRSPQQYSDDQWAGYVISMQQR